VLSVLSVAEIRGVIRGRVLKTNSDF
jgi:hypothetical protein